MAVLGGYRPKSLLINSYRFVRYLRGKPGGCTTRRRKTEARRWLLQEIDSWLRYHLEPEIYDDMIWSEGNLPTTPTWADEQRDKLLQQEFISGAAKASFEAWKELHRNKGFHLLKDIEPLKPRYSSLSGEEGLDGQ